MKRRVSIGRAIAFLLLALSPWAVGVSARGRQPGMSGLVLEMRPDKASYVLGETVALEFTVMNESATTVTLAGGADVWRGSIEVFVAFGDEGYREYRGPRWGLDDVVAASPMTLAPGGVYRTEATLLYNHRVETAHLAPSRARAIEEAQVSSPYALARPGIYSIKAVLYDARFEDRIESEPVVIGVVEPSGEEIEIWNQLQGDPELGYFIQTGGPRGHPTAPRSLQLATTLERIVDAHPGGRYTAAIQSALAQYRTSVELLRQQRRSPGNQP